MNNQLELDDLKHYGVTIPQRDDLTKLHLQEAEGEELMQRNMANQKRETT